MLWRSFEPAEGDYGTGSALESTMAVGYSLQKNQLDIYYFFFKHIFSYSCFTQVKYTCTPCWVQTSLCDGTLPEPLPQYWVCEPQCKTYLLRPFHTATKFGFSALLLQLVSSYVSWWCPCFEALCFLEKLNLLLHWWQLSFPQIHVPSVTIPTTPWPPPL